MSFFARPREGRRVIGGEARPAGTRLCLFGPGGVRHGGRAGIGRAWWLVSLLPSAISLLNASPLRGQEPAPDADWFTFDTPNFAVTFPAALESVARRAAARAEAAHALLSAGVLRPPDGRTHLVLADNVDLPNGSATVVPRRRIVLHVQPPASDPHLAFHDDWLEQLILHELVHVFHLESAGSPWVDLRRVFGREALLYPQYFTPSWVAEGLATYVESAHTQAGRVRGTAFEMILRTAVLEGEFFPIDRATVNPIAWPAATTPYVYGAMFVDHLAGRYGAAAVSQLVDRYGRQIVPYRLESAARRTIGTDLSSEWAIWHDSLSVRYAALADTVRGRGQTVPELLTAGGRTAALPRYAPDGSLVYSSGTGRSEAALVAIGAAGDERRLAPISLPGAVSWDAAGSRAIFTTLEYIAPDHLYSDLFTLDAGGGRSRLTNAARVWEADIHPDGRTAVAVRSAGGTNVLVRVHLSSGQVEPLTAPNLDTYWAAPRWSPDGRSIAVSRWSDGNLDIVILDSTGAMVRQVTHDRALDTDPAWSPDGRYLLFSSDRTGIANLFAWDSGDGALRQVTEVLTGAFQPDVSPDGRWIAFSFYRADGYHIARIPFDPASWRPAPDPVPQLGRPLDRPPAAGEVGGEARRYSAWPTVLPTRWAPVVVDGAELGLGLGFRTSGRDVVRRHEWDLELRGFTDRLRADGAARYRFRGWGNPVPDLLLLQEWSLQRAAGPSPGDPEVRLPALLRREREVEISVVGSRPRWRSFAWGEIAGNLRKSDFFWDESTSASGRAPFRFPLDLGATLGGGFSTVRSHGVALGPQDGALASARLQARRLLSDPPGDATDRSYWRLTGRALGFRGFDLYGFAPSVLALRLEGGVEASDATPGFTVGGGGASGTSRDDTDLLRGGTRYPIRGYPAGFQGGNRVLIGSAEYRFPIVLVERGFRLLPLAVDRLWGDVFLDAGTAWCPDTCAAAGRIPTSPSPLLSVGIETMLELRLGYFADLPLRIGVAAPLLRVGERTPELYLRIGRSF